jgi:hypothetical protein
MKDKDVIRTVNCLRCDADLWFPCLLPMKPGKIRQYAKVVHRERIRLAGVMERLRKRIEHRRMGRLWGQKHFFTPRVLGTVFGDGGKILYLSSINVRPAYWVVRIDSGWSTNNWEMDARLKLPSDWLDDVYQAIEYEFGTGEKEDGSLYADARYPQACALGDGTSWSEAQPEEFVKLVG